MQHKDGAGRPRLNPTLAAAGLTLLGLTLRLVGLGTRPLWFDEAISAVYAGQDWAGLLALNAGDNHPPGFYALLKLWIGLFGTSEAALRLLPVLPGAASVGLVYLIGRRLWPANPGPALTGTALTALSPFQIYFSQELRNYSLLLCAVLAATICWLRALEGNRWRDWLGLGLAGTAGLLFNFTAAFYLLALGLYPLLAYKRNWQTGLLPRLWLTGAGAGALSGLLLLPKLTARLETIKGNFWIPQPDFVVVLRTFYTFLFGATPAGLFAAALALALVILVMGMGQSLACLFRPDDEGLHKSLWLLWVPLLAMVAVSYLYQPLYLDKALIGCAPFYYLLLGRAMFGPGQGPRRRGSWLPVGAPLLAALPLALVALPPLYDGTLNPLYIARYDAARVNTWLAEQAGPSDTVLTVTDIAWLPLRYYSVTGGPPVYPLKEYPYPNIFPALLERLGSRSLSLAEAAQRPGRVWVIFEVNRPEAEVRGPPAGVTPGLEPAWLHSPAWQRETLAWFEARYRRAAAYYLDRLLVVGYEKPAGRL